MIVTYPLTIATALTALAFLAATIVTFGWSL